MDNNIEKIIHQRIGYLTTRKQDAIRDYAKYSNDKEMQAVLAMLGLTYSDEIATLNAIYAALQSVTIISDIPNNEHYAHNLFMRCADVWTDEHDWVMTIERFKQCFIEWQRQSVTLVEEKEPEAIEFAEWISTEGYMRLSKKVGHKWVKIGEPETYEMAEVYKLYKLWIESDRICIENVKRAFKSI